ncbi:MAG: hypothetical protein NC904_02675 [Candidatus Omnitrophica bacterium]|nr:hypothetical protein [Candidatus Omnitrophota bacterium]
MITDQAERLRQLIAKKAQGVDLEFENVVRRVFGENKPIFVFLGLEEELLSFCNFSGNIAIELSKFDKEVFLIDAYSGKVNTSLIFGIDALNNLREAGRGNLDFKDTVYPAYKKVRLSLGWEEIVDIGNWPINCRLNFFDYFNNLKESADIIIINELSLKFSAVLNNVILVFSPTQKNLMDIYKKFKKLTSLNLNEDCFFGFILNNVTSLAKANEFSRKFITMSKEFLGKDIKYLGEIVLSPEILKSIKAKKPFVTLYPYSYPVSLFRKIAQSLVKLSLREEIMR